MSANINCNGTMKSLLILDDEEGIVRGLKRLFEREGFTVYTAGNYSSAVEIVKNYHLHGAIMDIRLNGEKNGIDLLETIRKTDVDIVPIMITGYGSIESAIEAMKLGAADYILKPLDNAHICDVVFKNLELADLRQKNSFMKETLQKSETGFLTESPVMKGILKKIDKIKNTDASILITGESGTGKEILAHHIHNSSNRQNENIVCINCAALSESLLLSELFGHEKGAFTGAVGRKTGKFEIANKGTLFLDEIGDMTMETQARLLRVLEDKMFERLGSNKKIHTDVRLLAATNKNLEELIDQGLFRKDLYYRINVISFHLPPLRKRKEDIIPLTESFIDMYNIRYGKNISSLSPAAGEILCSHSWPGNIRELKNIINQAVLLSDSETISPSQLHDNVGNRESPSKEDLFSLDEFTNLKDETDKLVEKYERSIISQALEKNNSNRTRTAEYLGVTRKTLFDKMKKYDLEP